MRDWIGRFLLIAAIAGTATLAAGYAPGPAWAAGLAFAAFLLALGFALRERARLARLARWLARPAPGDMPDESGPWDDLYARLHRAFREQRETRGNLSHALWRFRQAAEAMPDGVLVLDGEHRIEWMNPAAEAHFGIAFRRDRGQAVTNLIRHPGFVAYLDSRHYAEPLLLKGPAEGDRILSVQLVPYGEREKLLLSRDVTRWERLEQMRRDFIANVSHELRTPLTVMRGFLETLSEAGEADGKLRRRSLELMTDQSERMQRLVEDLLQLSRLEDSRYPLREEAVDVPALVAAVVAEGESLSGGRHRLAATIGRAWLHASREELRSAFTNLVTNAIRYTPPGGRIEVTWGLEGGEPVMRVKDDGEGIAPEHVPRLTERFYRVDQSRSRASGGTGLGLAIVKHVLQRHQGQLEIESAPGLGSAFACRFPASRLAPAAEDTAIAAAPRASREGAGQAPLA